MSSSFSYPELQYKKYDLPVESGTYFSSIALAVWDNIHGPKLLHVWTGQNPRALNDDRKLVTIANFTLNDEAGRDQEGIETKFYSLPKHGVIASAFVFSLEVVEGKQAIFSFILILPYHELSEYLARHAFCQDKAEKLLCNHFVSHLVKMSSEKALLIDKVDKVISECFRTPLMIFTELMSSIRAYAIPHPIDIKQTFLGDIPALERQSPNFLKKAITSHLQTGGYTVVLGQDSESVNRMILTLGLFLTPKEQKTSRLLSSPVLVAMEDGEGVNIIHLYHYEPGLYLQGYTSMDTNNSSLLPFTKSELEDNCMPSTIINMDKLEVWVFNINLANYIRERSERIRKFEEEKKGTRRSEYLSYNDKDLCNYEICAKQLDSSLVQVFLREVQLLPVNTPGVIESYTTQFIRLLNLKAFALVKYVEAELKTAAEQQASAMGDHSLQLAASSLPRMNTTLLMQNLSINTEGDLRVIVTKAERIRPMTCLDVLDPQEPAAKVLAEFDTF